MFKNSRNLPLSFQLICYTYAWKTTFECLTSEFSCVSPLVALIIQHIKTFSIHSDSFLTDTVAAYHSCEYVKYPASGLILTLSPPQFSCLSIIYQATCRPHCRSASLSRCQRCVSFKFNLFTCLIANSLSMFPVGVCLFLSRSSVGLLRTLLGTAMFKSRLGKTSIFFSNGAFSFILSHFFSFGGI